VRPYLGIIQRWRRPLCIAGTLLAAVAVCSHATAGVTGTTGAVQFVSNPPSDVSSNHWESNTQIRLFAEQQSLTLAADLPLDISVPGTSPGATDSNLSPSASLRFWSDSPTNPAPLTSGAVVCWAKRPESTTSCHALRGTKRSVFSVRTGFEPTVFRKSRFSSSVPSEATILACFRAKTNRMAGSNRDSRFLPNAASFSVSSCFSLSNLFFLSLYSSDQKS
jgi:hypothetical protein